MIYEAEIEPDSEEEGQLGRHNDGTDRATTSCILPEV
jgi:hypothetical protein